MLYRLKDLLEHLWLVNQTSFGSEKKLRRYDLKAFIFMGIKIRNWQKTVLGNGTYGIIES